MPDQLIAAIEAGGTKVLRAVATVDGQVLAHERATTGPPEATFAAIAEDPSAVLLGAIEPVRDFLPASTDG